MKDMNLNGVRMQFFPFTGSLMHVYLFHFADTSIYDSLHAGDEFS